MARGPQKTETYLIIERFCKEHTWPASKTHQSFKHKELLVSIKVKTLWNHN